VSGNPAHSQRERGAKLAAALEDFLREEIPDREVRAQVLLGALEYLEQQTRAARPGWTWPSGERGWPSGD
jgi:hypothetical protein